MDELLREGEGKKMKELLIDRNVRSGVEIGSRGVCRDMRLFG